MPTIKTKTVRSPLWAGPCDSGPQGGITFSLLSRFISCRERFRIAVIEGLRPVDSFNHRLAFGDMWHTCEQALASGVTDWVHNLCLHAQILCRRYPLQQEQVDHWYNVCRVTFPLYVDYWAKHPDVISRRPLLSEQLFNVPYQLPSARTVRLRGKWDSVDLVGEGKGARIILQENKTKGDVREAQLRRQLRFDLQLGIYLVALRYTQMDSYEPWGRLAIGGVRYNVIRRPLSGGKGSISRHKPKKSNPDGESKEAFFLRLRDIIAESPQDYFLRWDVGITPSGILKFRRECLDPILEQLCDWWEAMQDCDGDYFRPPTPHGYVHWRHPFGVFDALNEGGSSDLDEYLETGSTVGLERAITLFPELEGDKDVGT
jgi:PD-(D/E)XK nuclease superfamily